MRQTQGEVGGGKSKSPTLPTKKAAAAWEKNTTRVRKKSR
jgi:hypothetical protein